MLKVMNMSTGKIIEDEFGSFEDEVLGAWGVPATPGIRRPSPTSRRFQSQTPELSYLRIANPTSRALNPAFDVTPPELITGIITPHGIYKPKALARLKRAG